MDLADKGPERSCHRRALHSTSNMASDGAGEAITTTPGGVTGLVGIEQRPKVVEERTRLGDLEVDFMMCKVQKSALLVITDRATLLTRLKKVTSRQAEHIEAAIE